jgi:molybdopterin molybdotransferase
MEGSAASPTSSASFSMLTVEEAQQNILGAVRPLESETVALEEAAGRVLREDVVAPFDVPPRDNSAMDGFAVRAGDIADAPVTLRVVEDLAAGARTSVRIEEGTAARIMTGAPVPDGADTVVPVELTALREFPVVARGAEERGGTVTIERPLPRRANIRRAGEDIRAGAVVLEAGLPIGAAECGILASVQKTAILAGRRPSVAIVATGDELVDAGAERAPGAIVNSNSYSLAALVRQTGAVPEVRGIVHDEPAATARAIESALSCDFVLTTGGVSAGAYDYVKEALDALGAETQFWRVAMKPGKPLVFARLRGRLVFGLPGNPVSCMVAFHLFVAPALRKAVGQRRGLLPPLVNVRLAAPVASKGDRRTYLRARVTAHDGELVAEPMRAQGSGVLTSMAGANGLVVLEEGVRGAEAGSLAPTLLIAPVYGD